MESIKESVFRTKRKELDLREGPFLVGILNITPDSFSDGGKFSDIHLAKEHFLKMESEGAAIIDIGGESTRPNYKPVSVKDEINRILPFLKKIRNETDCLISIDTSKAQVAEQCLAEGADIINDVWGGQSDPEMLRVVSKYDAACFLMHNSHKIVEDNLMESISNYLLNSIKLAKDNGVNYSSCVIDPGFGFGKSYEDNWEIMRNIKLLKKLGMPTLIGTSRKSMIANLLNIQDPEKRINGTLATTAWAAIHGVDFIRVHDVLANMHCIQVIKQCQKK